jgi:tripartite-type tricarboxylate transporter receptor subunit TctC
MKKLTIPILCFSLGLFLIVLTSWVRQTEAAGESFRDKEISMIVATNPGGSYDQYGILMAKSLEQKLQAKVNVRYVTGAGMINGANEIFNAPPDGLTLGTFNIGLIIAQLREEKGVGFDLLKFTWIGNAASMPRFLSIRASLPYKDFEDVRKARQTLKIPSSGVGSSAHNDVLMIKRILGLNIDAVPGFGGAETDKAIKSGEMDGRMGSSSSLLPYFQNGQLRPLLIVADKRDPAYPDVPTLSEIAPKDMQPMVKLMVAMSEIARPFAAPPGLPEEIRKPLQQAFAETFADPAFKEMARKAKMPFQYYNPPQVGKMVADALNQPSEVVGFLKAMVITE